MNPQSLTVYKSPFQKERIGRDFDGGYVVCTIPDVKYDILIGAGISNDTSFEDMWLEKNPGIKCIGFDGTIQSCPSKNPNFTWINKNIGPVSDANHSNLSDLVDTHQSVFLKMDIEGAEIPWLETLTLEQMNRLSQIVIEFHFPFSARHGNVFEKINKTHKLLHFHCNNCCGTHVHKDVVIPNVFECTYVHNKYITGKLELNDVAIPSELDQPNIKTRDDISITHPPFVHSTNTQP